MIYFIGILLFIFYIAIDVINYFSGRNISKISFFFSGFGILQLFLGILTLSQVSLAIYEPISYIVTTLTIFFGICYIFWIYYKGIKNKEIIITENDKISKKEYFISRSFSWLMIILTFIIQLFLAAPDHDSTYYVAISNNFVNSGIYSSTGIQGDVIPQYYLLTTSFFLYATLFQNDLQLGYTVFNQIVFLLLIFSILSLIFDNSKIREKRLRIFLYSIGVIFSSVLFFVEFTSIQGGNFSIQRIAVLSFFLSTYYIKNKNIALFMIPFGAAFFSSTAILIGPILIFSALVYHFIKKDGFKAIKYFPFLIITLFFSIILFFDPVFNFIMTLSENINYFIIFYVILIFISILFFSMLQFWENRKKITNIDFYQKFNNQKGFYFLTIMLLILPILAVIFWWLIPTISSNPNIKHYAVADVLIPLGFGVILTIFTIKLWKDQRKIYDLAFVFMIFWAISIIVKILLTIPVGSLERLNTNASSWRISYTFIGFSRFDSIFYLFIFLIHLANNFKFIKSKKSRMTIYPLALLIPFIVMGTTAPILKSGIIISSGISVNKKYFTNSEIDFLNNLSFNNFSESYITTAPISPYLYSGTNITGQIVGPNEAWWSLASGGSAYNISAIEFEERFRLLKNNLANESNIFSIRGEQITNIDYIFLNKKTDSFGEIKELPILKDFYNCTWEGDNIFVYWTKVI